jgi:hypothetical protein
MGAGPDAFLHPWPEPEPDPPKTGFGFRFSPTGALKTKKNLKPKKIQNPKETQNQKKNLKKTRNPKTPENPQKNPIYKTQQARGPDPKLDGFRFGCQISPAGSGVKFNSTTFFRGSGFQSTRTWPIAIPNRVNFLYIWPNKICVNQTSVVSSLLPLLWPTSLQHHAVSRFFLNELRQARCLHFIFRKCFIPSSTHSSRNQNFESTPTLPATLPRSSNSHPPLL